jgi:hypothetical protein
VVDTAGGVRAEVELVRYVQPSGVELEEMLKDASREELAMAVGRSEQHR